MNTESTDIITHCCWDMHPKTSARCTLEPGHTGDHRDWHTRPSWDRPCVSWPAEAAPHQP
ncbi:hypothetical protein ABZ826_10485 [Streptomyces sp. NPDC047515]|uniref:hypothetical protein n=1 Tax=Streptomyces sp. NPDC047515 TaxID=3155380 RepID=UPI0033C5C47B